LPPEGQAASHLKACEDAHDKGGYFLYGYLLVSFAMWKWQAPSGRALHAPLDRKAIAKSFDPWKTRSDAPNVAFNENAFGDWYNQLIAATQVMRVPQPFISSPKTASH